MSMFIIRIYAKDMNSKWEPLHYTKGNYLLTVSLQTSHFYNKNISMEKRGFFIPHQKALERQFGCTRC